MTFKMDARLFYGLILVLVLAGALGAGFVVSRQLTSSPARPAAVPAATTGAPAQVSSAGASAGAGAASALAIPTQATDNAPRISIDDALKEYGKPNVVFIDVRVASAFTAGHIKGAVSFPEADMETRWKELPQDKDIVLYCA